LKAEPPLSVEEAQRRSIAVARPVGAERVMLRQARGRVLAEEVRARADAPPHDNSAMDGFALRASDGQAGASLAIAGEVAAGHVAPRPLGAGEAYRIMTGAPIPPGADAVIMVEHTETSGDRVKLGRAVSAGDHIRRAGEDVRAGDPILSPGITLGAAELGVLASQQRAQVRVSRRPVVALLSTGDELRDVDQPLQAGAIAESNSYSLAALVEQAGGVPRVMPLVRDDPALIRAAFEEARTADAIVTSGGVSVGEHDHVKSVLDALGAEWSFWRVNMKPGKPVAVARLGQVPCYGLPGNPVSSIVSFLLFVRPALRAMQGAAQPLDLPRAAALLDTPLRAKAERRSYLRARLRWDEAGALRVQPMPRQGSHVLTSMVGAGALVIVEPGTHDLPAGATVAVLLIA
jgi:molybdopterin molybdotransferase